LFVFFTIQHSDTVVLPVKAACRVISKVRFWCHVLRKCWQNCT